VSVELAEKEQAVLARAPQLNLFIAAVLQVFWSMDSAWLLCPACYQGELQCHQEDGREAV
jgi:hypothetical protein